MKKNKRNKNTMIWLSVLILFICVALTTIAVVDVLNVFSPDDSGAIPLVPEDTSDGNQNQTTPGADSPETTRPATPVNTEPMWNPEMEASDNKTVWNASTQVEMFKISYENGEKHITVKSDNGDKVIAPGVKNSYTFKLKNTGDVALDYTLEIDAYITSADISVPITAKLSRYDGEWIIGDKESYAEVSALDGATDQATVGAGRYTYYTIDWTWPFESGDDEFDTLLGNTATEQNVVFKIAINAISTISSNPYDDSGIASPQTGDTSRLTLWGTLAICSFVMLIFLLFFRREDDEEELRKKAGAKKF